MLDAATNPYPADNMLAQLVKQQDPPIPYCDLFPQMSFPFQGKLAMECYTQAQVQSRDRLLPEGGRPVQDSHRKRNPKPVFDQCQVFAPLQPE
jgi:hypothetical protein